jgi:hypothetical protein
VEWLAVSLVLSIVLTVLLNVWLRLFPGAGARAARKLDELTASDFDDHGDDRSLRVIVPWKAMLVASVVLTVALNLLLWIL